MSHDEGDLSQRYSIEVNMAKILLSEGLVKVNMRELATLPKETQNEYLKCQKLASDYGLGMWLRKSPPQKGMNRRGAFL